MSDFLNSISKTLENRKYNTDHAAEEQKRWEQKYPEKAQRIKQSNLKFLLKAKRQLYAL